MRAKNNSRTTFVAFKTSANDKVLIRETAEKLGLTMSTFIYNSVMKSVAKEQRNG